MVAWKFEGKQGGSEDKQPSNYEVHFAFGNDPLSAVQPKHHTKTLETTQFHEYFAPFTQLFRHVRPVTVSVTSSRCQTQLSSNSANLSSK